jgi:predicted nucleic acid-binding protein
MPSDSIVFLDTNILLYAASGRPSDRPRSERARHILQTEQCGLSFQVLQEFYANAVNPRKLNLSAAEAAEWCAAWIQLPMALLGAETFVRTLELVQRFQISNWDAAILAAAAQLGCTMLYSEDLSHGQDYVGVEVVNPFRGLSRGSAKK